VAKIFVLSYPPGAGGDYLAGRVVSSSNKFYTEYHSDEYEYTLRGPNNAYYFTNSLRDIGIEEKSPYYYPVINTSSYPDIPIHSRLKDLPRDVLDEFWNMRIERYFGKLNILGSTHIKDITEYPWPGKAFMTCLFTHPTTVNLISFLFIIKNLKNSFDNEIFECTEADILLANDDSFIKLYYKPGDKFTKFEKQFLVNNMKSVGVESIPKELLNQWINVMQNGTTDHTEKVALTLKIMMYHTLRRNVYWNKELNIKNCTPIRTEKLFNCDIDELATFFKSFEISEFDEKPIQAYMDKNLALFDKAGGDSGWIDYSVDQILSSN
jgi:hypothetical protein